MIKRLDQINILSLDAPMVSCVWLYLFQTEFSANIPPHLYIVLFSIVWIIYISDRLIDNLRKPLYSTRHRVVQSKRNIFILIASSALLLNLLILSTEKLKLIQNGAILGILIILYLCKFTAKQVELSYLLKKKLSASILFTLGTSLPLWTNQQVISIQFLFCLLILTLLCLCNLLLISLQELRSTQSLSIQKLKSIWIFIQSVSIGSSLLGIIIYNSVISMLALIILILNFLNQTYSKTPECKRLLADWCLLSPVLGYIMIQRCF